MRYLFAALLLIGTVNADEHIKPELIRASHRVRVVDGIRMSLGTGVAIDARHVITACHVAFCENKDAKVGVDVHDDDGVFVRTIPAKVLRVNHDADLALIETEKDIEFTKIEYGDCKLGDTTVIIGAAHGECPYCIVTGIFMTHHSESVQALMETSATVVAGNSGGGVYCGGKLIGIVVMGAPEVGALIVPSSVVRAFVEAK